MTTAGMRFAGGIMAAALAAVVPAAAPGTDNSSRVRDVPPRVLDIVVRVESLDGNERVTESATQVEVALGADVLFAFDHADLSPDAAARLSAVVDLVRQRPPVGVVAVEGHSDDVGDEAYNLGLSERRAATVRDALVQALGAGAPAFEARGFGESKPVAPNKNPDGSDNPAGRQRNRRVDVRWTTSG